MSSLSPHGALPRHSCSESQKAQRCKLLSSALGLLIRPQVVVGHVADLHTRRDSISACIHASTQQISTSYISPGISNSRPFTWRQQERLLQHESVRERRQHTCSRALRNCGLALCAAALLRFSFLGAALALPASSGGQSGRTKTGTPMPSPKLFRAGLKA